PTFLAVPCTSMPTVWLPEIVFAWEDVVPPTVTFCRESRTPVLLAVFDGNLGLPMLLHVRVSPVALTPNSTPLRVLEAIWLLSTIGAVLAPVTKTPSPVLPRPMLRRGSALTPTRLKPIRVDAASDTTMPCRPLADTVFPASLTLPPTVTEVVLSRKIPASVLPRAFSPIRSVPTRLLWIRVPVELTT